jgi:hypothetical protein
MAHAHKPMPAINPPHSKTRAKVSLAGVVFGTSSKGSSSSIIAPLERWHTDNEKPEGAFRRRNMPK